MWNRLKQLVAGQSKEPAPPEPAESPSVQLQFDDARPEVEEFLKIDIGDEKADSEQGEQAISVMKKMAQDIDQIERAAKGDPNNTIDGGLWLSGAGYGNLAQEMTKRFKEAGWLDHEQFASALWARATLAVNARHHHLVGPAMLANADCQQRLGNPDRATHICTSIIKDFIFLIGTWQQKQTEIPVAEDRTALECLQTAIETLLKLGTTEIDGTDLKASGEHIRQILDRRPSNEQ